MTNLHAKMGDKGYMVFFACSHRTTYGRRIRVAHAMGGAGANVAALEPQACDRREAANITSSRICLKKRREQLQQTYS